MVDALFLQNSKEITNKIPQPENPSTGNLEKKSLFSPYCGDKTATFYDRAFLFKKRLQGWKGEKGRKKRAVIAC